jgi:hypothetical protein
MLYVLLVGRKEKKKRERNGQEAFFSHGGTPLAGCAMWDFCGS